MGGEELRLFAVERSVGGEVLGFVAVEQRVCEFGWEELRYVEQGVEHLQVTVQVE